MFEGTWSSPANIVASYQLQSACHCGDCPEQLTEGPLQPALLALSEVLFAFGYFGSAVLVRYLPKRTLEAVSFNNVIGKF
jgi:hypothetical protein